MVVVPKPDATGFDSLLPPNYTQQQFNEMSTHRKTAERYTILFLEGIMSNFNSYEDLFSQLRKDETLDNETKFKMTTNYVRSYGEKMATTTQSSDDLKTHLSTLNMIQAENAYYKGLI